MPFLLAEIDMKLNFSFPVKTSAGSPATYLGRDSENLWNVITYYIEADDDELNTGWSTVEVDDYGITRADIEDEVVDPDPFVVQASESNTLTLGIYPNSSIVSNFFNPEALPFGEVGRASLTYETKAGKLVSVTVNSILPDRG